MNTLWNLGDSFTAPFDTKCLGQYGIDYINYKGYTPKTHGQFIAHDIGYDYKFISDFPSDVETVIDNFTDYLPQFKSSDIVLVGWPPINRIRWYHENPDRWYVFNIPSIEDELEQKKDGLPVDVLTEYLLNKHNLIYLKSLKKRIKLMNMSLPDDVQIYHWSWTDHNYLESFDLERICDETNNVIDDTHWSENGHKVIADWFLSHYHSNTLREFFSEDNLPNLL